MYSLFRTALVATLVLIASAAPSTAGFIDLSVGTTGPGGSLTIASTGIIGTGITVVSAQGQGTNANDGVTSPITNGVLNFSTGAFLSTDSSGNRFYANGGSVTVTGTAQGFTGTLLSASFSGTNPIQLQNLGNGNFELLGGSLLGTVAPALASFYNFDQLASNQGGFSLLLGGVGATPTVNSGDLAMTTSGVFNPLASVPEPASLSLLASGLVGTLVIGCRRTPRAA